MRRHRSPLLVAGILAVVACGDSSSPSALDPKGDEADRLAGLWWLLFGLATAVFLVVTAFIVVGLVRGRGTSEGKGSRIGDGTFIGVGGLIVPVAVLAVVAVATVGTTKELRRPAPDPVRIDVVGKRWWWDVRYPGTAVVTANEIHVPVGRPVELALASDNVIHSFWVPQLAGKVDMIPGQRNLLRFTVTEAGTYRGQCAEYCGLQHGRMAFLVIADQPADFDRWMAARRSPPPPPTGLAAAGRDVLETTSCAGCHRVQGTTAQGVIGPDLTDFGSRSTIGALTVPNDRGNLGGWIANAQSIKTGSLMPPISVDPDELQALLAYLESLRPAAAP
ncbi:MAG: cytochrome c oxidase subunit II [Acidimicrobiales bacterium]